MNTGCLKKHIILVKWLPKKMILGEKVYMFGLNFEDIRILVN